MARAKRNDRDKFVENLTLLIHAIACSGLVLIVLLQAGRGMSLGGLFGGGGSEAIFGGTGGNTFLKKVTIVLASVFMLTALSLTIMKARGTRVSVMSGAPIPAAAPAPAPAPAPATTPPASPPAAGSK